MAQTISIKSTRESWLDIIRITACIMVIMMHATTTSSSNGPENSNAFNAIVSYLMSPCNGLFFMVSGALLLKSRPIQFGAFLKKRVGRILPPLVSWSIIYIVLRFCIGRYNITDVANAIIMLPFSAQGCGYFWFMYVLMGCYIMIPVWSSWLESASRRSLECILILWFVTSFIPMIIKFFPYVEEFNSWMYYLAGFMGYFLLGYYIRTYSEVASWRNIFIGIILTMILLGIHLYVTPELNPRGRLYCYLQPYVISACCSIFCFARKSLNNIDSSKITLRLSDATFGIYLSQSLILNYILKEADIIRQLSPLIGFSFRVIATFIIAYILVRLINYTPLKRILLI